MQWIPLLEDGELHTGSYHLCISAEKPPPAYSQLKTDVRTSSHDPVYLITQFAGCSAQPQVDGEPQAIV